MNHYICIILMMGMSSIFQPQYLPFDIAWYDAAKNIITVSNKERSRVKHFRGTAPAISPDGRKLAAVETSFAFNEKFTSILIFDLHTEKANKIKAKKTRQLLNPRWSSDGRAILVTCEPLLNPLQPMFAIINTSNNSVDYIMHPAGERITICNWTPDGKYVCGVGENTIYLFDTKGNRVKTIEAEWLENYYPEDFQLAFNSSMTKIAVIKKYKKTPFERINTGLFTADLASGKIQQISAHTEKCGRLTVDKNNIIFYSVWVFGTLDEYVTYTTGFNTDGRKEILQGNFLTMRNDVKW